MKPKLIVVIVDYEMGNIKSIENAVNQIGDFDVKITADENSILQADVIILPGVGAFPDAMKKLKERNLVEVLNQAVITNKTPTLGICLGMQILFDSSQEKVLTNGLATTLSQPRVCDVSITASLIRQSRPRVADHS